MSENMRVLYCKCEHEYQDKKLGPGQRWHNYALKADGWRCTVCGILKSASGSGVNRKAS